MPLTKLLDLTKQVSGHEPLQIEPFSDSPAPPTAVHEVKSNVMSPQVVSNAGQDGFLSHEPSCTQVSYIVGGQPHFHNKGKHRGFDSHSGEHSDAHRDGLISVPFTSDKPLSMAKWQRSVHHAPSMHASIFGSEASIFQSETGLFAKSWWAEVWKGARGRCGSLRGERLDTCSTYRGVQGDKYIP